MMCSFVMLFENADQASYKYPSFQLLYLINILVFSCYIQYVAATKVLDTLTLLFRCPL